MKNEFVFFPILSFRNDSAIAIAVKFVIFFNIFTFLFPKSPLSMGQSFTYSNTLHCFTLIPLMFCAVFVAVMSDSL